MIVQEIFRVNQKQQPCDDAMSDIKTDNAPKKGWVYTFVCEPGPKESFFGLFDEEKNVNVIPVFRNKDDANDCFLTMPREKGKKYELQAVHIGDIQEIAAKNGFVVTLVDGEGRLVQDN